MNDRFDAAPVVTAPPLDDPARPARVGPVALADGRSAVIALRDGRIHALAGVEARPAWLALPAFANLHAHAERSFSFAAAPGSFADAVRLAGEIRRGSSVADFAHRAGRLFARALAHGTALVRTHTDIDDLVEERALQGVLAARDAFAGRLDVEIVAFANSRVDPATADGRRRVERALAAGATVIGATPNHAPDPPRALAAVLDLARATGVPVDLHLDEHGDADASLAALAAEATIARGLEGRVTLAHLCALAVRPDAAAVSERIAAAGITVVALSATNLYLQDRGAGTPRRRGVTLAHELLRAGVALRTGSDNVRDTFYRYGDADPLEDAFLLALAAQLDDELALVRAICGGRAVPEPGDRADLVLVPAENVSDALARRPAGRVLLRGGAARGTPSPP